MTADIVAPHTAQLNTAIVAAPDLAAIVQAAQQAGDLAYAFAKRSGCTLVEQSIAYHAAFADTMREMGSPMPCPCELCTGGSA
jgi:hypothetical protein